MSVSQKALVLGEKFGRFEVQEIEVQHPKSGEILIKVQATALNPVDWKIQKYHLVTDGYPVVVGYDLAGDVEEVGSDVTAFQKGDRVFGCTVVSQGFHGSFQQYVIASAATTSKIPPGFSYDEVATLPVALSTAYSGLYAEFPHGLGLKAPDDVSASGHYRDIPILIIGGASSVGQVAIQLAKHAGFSPIITTASLKHEEVLRSFGADHVLDRNLSSADLKREIGRITEKPIDWIYDTISLESTQQLALDVLAPGGTVTLVLPPVVKSTEQKRIAEIHAGLLQPHNIPLLHDLYREKAYDLLVKGIIKPNRFEVLPGGLNGILGGLARLEADEVSRLKLVVHPQETP